jgi:hypothetical protein
MPKVTSVAARRWDISVTFTVGYRSLIPGGIISHVMQIAIRPEAKMKHPENDAKAAVGRISDAGWTVYKASME